MRTTLTTVGLLLVAVVLAGCGGSQQTAQSGSESDPSGAGDTAVDAADGQSPTVSDDADDSGEGQGDTGQTPGQRSSSSGGHSEPAEVPANAQTRRVEASEYAFEPADLAVEAGRPVAVTLTNAGQIEHEWVLVGDDGSEIAHAHTQSGGEATAVFTLDQPGTYDVRCTIPGHTEQGMMGTVTAS